MKKQLVFASLAWCLFGFTYVPANADEVWFKTYDTNGDGLWDYKEFCTANDGYCVKHPKEVRVTTKELRRQFDDLDTDHDGLVRTEEVKTYHTWE